MTSTTTTPLFLFVPGAGGDPWYWHLVVDELRGHGRGATAVDLPAQDEGCGLAEYADATVSAAGEADDVVLVAHSLGAFTAAMAAGRLPVRAVGLVNAMLPAPGETPGEWWDATGQPAAQAEARGHHDPADDFTHDLAPEIARAVAERPRDQAAAVFGSRCEFQAWPPVPLQVLIGADDRFLPADFQQRLCRQRLGIEPTVVPGGHAIALSQSGVVAQWVEGLAS